MPVTPAPRDLTHVCVYIHITLILKKLKILIIPVQTVTTINKLMPSNLAGFILYVSEMLSQVQFSRVLASGFSIRELWDVSMAGVFGTGTTYHLFT